MSNQTVILRALKWLSTLSIFIVAFEGEDFLASSLSHSSVQFGRSVESDSLWPHELQHARPLCPSPTPGVHSDSRPSSRWSHPAISSSAVLFSSCPQTLPASESFPMSQLFAWVIVERHNSHFILFLMGGKNRVFKPKPYYCTYTRITLLAVKGGSP